ncbi:MAG: SDR family oxidoreductase [Candidatus Bathyarchaeia archaeon]
MKVLVTGGLGYLGSILIEKLIKLGFEVRVLDSILYGNFITDVSDSFELIKGDIRDEKVLQSALKDVEAVVHLAGIIGDTASSLDMELSIDVNYLATKKLAELCGKRNVKLIFSSTCSVYGAQPGQLITEKSKVAPLSLYAFSKLLSEKAIERLCKKYVIFRLGTLFGFSPRMRFDLVINKFIGQAIQGKTITVFGGEQYRPFVHLQDVTEYFIKALNVDINGIYNIGGNNYKIIEVAERLKKKLNCEIVTVEEQNDPRNYAVDSTYVKEVFGNINFKRVEFAVDEIKAAYASGIIKDYRDPIFDNERWLRQIWRLGS